MKHLRVAIASFFQFVIPAKAGIQGYIEFGSLGPRFRGDDE
jgi:hypothetical protein